MVRGLAVPRRCSAVASWFVRVLSWVLLLHLAVFLVCSLAHHLLALLLQWSPVAVPLHLAGSPASIAQFYDLGALDKLCALVCESMYGLFGVVALGPSAAWLRDNGGLIVHPEGYHSGSAATAALTGQYFEGWYYKAVLEVPTQRSVVFIPGVLHEPMIGDGFGFVIAVDSTSAPSRRARLFRYPRNVTGPAVPRAGEGEWAFTVGPNRFSATGVAVDLDERLALSCEVSSDVGRLQQDASLATEERTSSSDSQCGTIVGELKHYELQPLSPSLAAPDAMGWLAYLPNAALPCRHGIVSLGHQVVGELIIDNAPSVDVVGHGYIEKDWGAVFPERWLWVQCNTFNPAPLTGVRGTDVSHSHQGKQKSASLLLSVAELPVPSPQLQFGSVNGILALLWVPDENVGGSDGGPGGELWRFASYNGEHNSPYRTAIIIGKACIELM